MPSIKLVTIVLLGLTCVVNLSSAIQVYDFPSKQLKEAFDLVLATRGQPVSGEKTLDYLKLLLLFYQEQHDTIDSAKFVELLKAGDMDITRCNRDTLDKINQLLEEWKDHINVRVYLKHYRQKLMRLCVPNLDEILTMHQKLFNLNSAHYTHGKKILSKLKELKLAMESDPNNLLGLNKDRVTKFLEFSEFDESKCNDDTNHSIGSTIANLSKAEQTHIKTYLEYITKHLYKFCNKKGKYAEGWRGWF